MKKIAVDAMGGDFAPLEIVLGAIQAVKEYKVPVVLVGDEDEIRPILEKHHEDLVLCERGSAELSWLRDRLGQPLRQDFSASAVSRASSVRRS